jgi:hypothetical protein
MNIVDFVVDAVEDLVQATADEVEAKLRTEGQEFTRAQIIKALHNGNYRGRLQMVGRRKRSQGKGGSLGVYVFVERAREAPKPRKRRKDATIMSSVLAYIDANGEVSLARLERAFPQYTKRQLHHAATNGVSCGALDLVRPGKPGRAKPRVCAVWAKAQDAKPVPGIALWTGGRVASVFDLGMTAACAALGASDELDQADLR